MEVFNRWIPLKLIHLCPGPYSHHFRTLSLLQCLLGWSGLYNFFFENTRSHSLSDAFLDAYHDELIEILIFSKKWHPSLHMCSKKSMGGQKSKCKNHIKWGSKKCKMMRGFQIWLQNSNQVTFDPFWQKNCQKLAKYPF